MKETGIVRKLDNLGRLVIPKEIRRCMRIKEGSPIEFGLLPSGEIVLCKYSLVNQISDYSDEFASILGSVFDCMVFIGDRDRIISSFGISKKSTIGMPWSSELLDVIDSKSSYKACKEDGTTILPIYLDDTNTYYSQIIYPINIQGDIEGVVVLCENKEGRCLSNEHLTSLRVVATFLSSQME